MRFGRRGVDTSQIEDRRGAGGLALGGGGLGVAGLVIYLLVTVLGGGGASGFPVGDLTGLSPSNQRLACPEGAETDTACFVAAVVNDVQEVWHQKFDADGRNYRETRLVLFSSAVSSGCGQASSATGPFYCPADSRVYIDLGFFQDLKTQFGAPGDFAQAYVIAHEFGHHVQNVLGTNESVHRQQQRNPSQANALSVQLELQADCFAGVWAHDTSAELDPGDFREGIDAAAAIGDDRLQRQAGQRVDRESWTHGSSEQRVSWFQRGAANGDPAECDTFES